MKVGYLLSGSFDYTSLICDDAGPPIADDYALPALYLGRDDLGIYDIIIVDPWIREAELPRLREEIGANRRRKFLLRVTDPHAIVVRSQPWYGFCEEMLSSRSVALALTYTPADLTAFWFTKFPNIRWVFMPYVYDQSKERSIAHSGREHKMVLSGNRQSSIYPLRRTINFAVKAWPPLRAFCVDLAHPGYSLQKSTNAVVRDDYIDFLARYRFASTCSSYCRVELLKYREFAYAGVVPVGDLPFSMLDCPPDSWVSWRWNFVALTSYLRSMQGTEERAQKYREFMRELREITRMQDYLRLQLSELW